LTDEYDIDKKELEKNDSNVVDDAHSTLGDSSDKIYESIKTVTDKNKDADPSVKKRI